MWAGPELTLLAGGRRCAPGQVPLAGENVGAEELVARLALVSKHGAPDQVPVGGCPPAPLRGWQLGARVVPRDLCRGKTEFGGCPANDSGSPSSLGDLELLPRSLACRTPAHFRSLDLGTFEVQHETLPQAGVWGPWRCLELQREVGPRGEEAAARLGSPQLGQDSGAGTVPVEQCQHVPFAHIQAAGSGTR